MRTPDTSSASHLTSSPLRVTSADGVALAGVHLRAPGGAGGVALAVCHGFTHRTGRPGTRRVLAALARRADVVALDMRGHGRSAGRSTVGDCEVLDLDAAVRWARAAGYERVTTIGFSLGAAVALRHGAGERCGSRPDAVVAVSSPARWYSRETAAMRRVHWLLEQPHGRVVARVLGVRLGPGWATVPPSPVEVAGRIAPLPMLLVHLEGDPYFAAAHAHALVAASDGHAELWIEPGRGHGESGTGTGLATRIAAWALMAAPLGRPPDGTHTGRSTVGAGPVEWEVG